MCKMLIANTSALPEDLIKRLRNGGGRRSIYRYIFHSFPKKKISIRLQSIKNSAHWVSSQRRRLLLVLADHAKQFSSQGKLAVCTCMTKVGSRFSSEPVWSSGKALSTEDSEMGAVRIRGRSVLLSLQKLWSVYTVLWLCLSQLMKH